MAKNQMPDHRARLSRSGFDMSQSFAFTASTGMLLPVYSEFLNNGETVYVSDSLFARTQPMVTPAMADVDFYLDWFFVPMTMLYTGWGQTRMQVRDFVSSNFEAQSSQPGGDGYFPLHDLVGSYFNLASSQWNNGSTLSHSGTNFNTAVTLSPNNFDVVVKGQFRLLDALGLNPYGVFVRNSGEEVPTSGPFYNPSIFPWRGLAYQCIYQRWYRNDDYEPLLVSSYNVDRFASSGFTPLPTSPMFPYLLRWADYRRDYFTSIKPSAISSSLNVLNSGTTSPNVYSSLRDIDNFLASNYEVAVSETTGRRSNPADTVTSVNAGGVNLFNDGASVYVTGTAGLRSLFAVEKLLRITGRAAKDYDSQVLAHFGFKIPHDVKHDITRLRSSNGLLHIGEVVGTADTFNGTSGSALGELAGKGYVSITNKKKMKFTAPVDGALMCIFRAIPRQRIIGTFDKQNAVANRTDLYIPEFDKLGMQPLYDYEFQRSAMGTSGFSGWQFRYDQFKRKFDRASAVFASPGRYTDSVNQYSAWVLSRYGFGTSTESSAPISTAGFLKCPPTALNSIMVVPYVTTVAVENLTSTSPNMGAEYYTDPFICDFHADVKKVSTMSPSGEPDMISL